MKNILDYLELNVKKYSNKNIFVDADNSISYKEFTLKAKQIASSIDVYNKNIVIFMDKNIDLLVAMIGVLYSGNAYTIVDNKMPIERVNLILDVLKPAYIITCKKDKNVLNGNIKIYEEIIKTNINEKHLNYIRKNMIDTDTAYILFTSGSTGIPKGVVISHRALVSYVTWFTKCFKINSKTIFGNQTPFYFSMSVSDFYGTIMSGATLYIIPKIFFSFPIKLLDYLNDNKINTIYWVPSALLMVSRFKALDNYKLPYLKKVLFAGEVMPTKDLNYWQKHLKAMYANLFGPTETTDICTYYIIDRKFKDEDNLPIGYPCDNCKVMVISDDKEVEKGIPGELYVKGSFLADGYYGNHSKTADVFIQNPLNKFYPEIVYKTGDLVRYNELGQLEYISRKDFQIKHMGYRIELGEIENRINLIDKVVDCVCIYDKTNAKIVLFYVGEIDINILIKAIALKLPDYMQPKRIVKIPKMIYNINGKKDRVYFNNLAEGDK